MMPVASVQDRAGLSGAPRAAGGGQGQPAVTRGAAGATSARSEAPDLIGEYLAAVEALTNADIERLETMGVPPEVASGLVTPYPPLGKVRADVRDSGTYQPNMDGTAFYVCPVASGDLPNLDVLDLAAWRPSEPEKVYLRADIATILGPDATLEAHLWQKPLLVAARPLDWLRNRCQGVAVLRWTPGLPLYLGSGPALWCRDETTAAKIHAAYQMHIPEISHFEEHHDAAA